jgi:hypothetical protein
LPAAVRSAWCWADARGDVPSLQGVRLERASATIGFIAWRGSSALNRRKSKITPLVAARMRPARRPPFTAGCDRVATGLRIARAEKSVALTPAPLPDDTLSAELEEVRQTADALRSATAALDRILGLLMTLGEMLRSAREGRRRPPRASANLQQNIDSTLDAIDALIEGSPDSGGRPLLAVNSTFPAALRREGAGPKARRAEKDSKRADTNTSPRFLAMLRSAGAKSADRTDPAEMLAIVEGSAAKIASQRAELDGFLNGKVLPLLAMLEVTQENVRATQSAQHDTDFATAAGQITGGDALLNRFPAVPQDTRLTICPGNDD